MKTKIDVESIMQLARDCAQVNSMISTAIPTMDGWCTSEKALTLAGLVLQMKPKLCLEIGTYAGRSFLPILWALKENGGGKAIGIDPYDAKVSSEQEFPGNSEWWATLDHGLIEKKFHAFLKAFGVAQYAEIIKKKSSDVDFPNEIDIAHIDGGHCEGGFLDIQRITPKMRIRGVVVLDDIQWVGGAVLRGIDHLLENGYVECYRNVEQNWNIMQRG